MEAESHSRAAEPRLEEVLEAAAQSKPAALQTLIERTQGEAYRFAALLLASEARAEGIVPEAYGWLLDSVRGHHADPSLGARDGLLQNVYRLAAREEPQDSDARSSGLLGEVAASAPGAAAKFFEEWRSAWEGLGASTRSLWILHALEGRAAADAGRISGAPEDSVDAALERARAWLETKGLAPAACIERWRGQVAAIAPPADFAERVRAHLDRRPERQPAPERVLGEVDGDVMSHAFEAQLPGAPRSDAAKEAAPKTPAAELGSVSAEDVADWGSALDAVAALAPAPPPPDETRWFLAIDEKQVGPLSREQVERKLRDEVVDAETLCWREGLLDWLPLSRVVEFVALTQGRPRKLELSEEAAVVVAEPELPTPRASSPGLTVAELAREEITAARTRPTSELPSLALAAPETVTSEVPGRADLQPLPPVAQVPRSSALPEIPSTPPSPTTTEPPPAPLRPIVPSRPRVQPVKRQGLGVAVALLALVDLGLVAGLALSSVRHGRTSRRNAAGEGSGLVLRPSPVRPAMVPPAHPDGAVAAPTPPAPETAVVTPAPAETAPPGAPAPVAAAPLSTPTPAPAPVVAPPKADVPPPPPPNLAGKGDADAAPARPAAEPSEGHLTPEQIREGVLPHRPAIMACAVGQRQRAPAVHGTLVMEWTVLPNGRAKEPHAVSSELAQSFLARCIGKDVPRWKFPRPEGGPAHVEFPFKF